MSDLGGTAYPWSSPMSIGLIAVSLLAARAVRGDREKSEGAGAADAPVRQQTFVVTSLVGLIVGFALFGSVTYFPLYLQVVKGVSPTASGLEMLPMMGGMLVRRSCRAS